MERSELRSLRKGRERVIGGVCSGVAEYFMTDTVLVRALFVILGLASGIGVILYVLLWLLMPEADAPATQGIDVVREGFRSMGADITRIGDQLKKPAGTAAG